MKNYMKALIAALAIVLGVGMTAGCSSQDANSEDVMCMTQLTDAQRSELQQMADQNGNDIQTDGSTGQVCVLDDDGTQHYYNEDDQGGFSDYLLYSMLFGHANMFATVGLIQGDLSPMDALAISMLAGVNRDGSVYRPYSHNQYGWERHPTAIKNMTVKHVQYGSAAPVKYSDKVKAPKGYTKTTKLPTVKTDVAKVTSSGGKLKVTAVKPPSGYKGTYKNPSAPKTGSNKSGSNKCCDSSTKKNGGSSGKVSRPTKLH